MVVGKIFKDRVWKFVQYPKHLTFETINFCGINWSWNEEFNILIDNTHGIIMRIKKDEFFKPLTVDSNLLVYQMLCSNIVCLSGEIELWDTWFNQKEFEWLNT